MDSFNLTFDKYKNIIGRPGENDNYWFGLEKISKLTYGGNKGYTLRIDLQDCSNETAYEEYNNFWVMLHLLLKMLSNL